MRFISANLAALLVIFAFCMPVHAQATTQPALNPTVMIFPFRQIGEGGAHAWIPEAVQENLNSQVQQTNLLQAITPDPSAGSPDAQGAIAAAKAAHVGFAVYGSYQVVGDQLRLLGNVYDCVIDRNVGSLQATGNLVDFFKTEDTVASQLRQALPQLQPADNYGVNTSPLSGSSSYYSPPQESNVYPEDTGAYDQANGDIYTSSGYGYPNYYPYYGYGYGYGYGYPYFSYITINGHRYRYFHHGEGFNHGHGGQPIAHPGGGVHANVRSGAVENHWFDVRPSTPFYSAGRPSFSAGRPSFSVNRGSFGGFHGSVSHSFGHVGGGFHGGGGGFHGGGGGHR